MLVPDSNERTGSAIESNCIGFHNVMEAARIAKVRRVVWPSSQAVYGQADFYPPGPVSEDTFVNPTLVYGACKLFNEHIARFYRDQHKLDNIGFRKSVVYGLGKSRLRDISIAHYLVENAVLGRTLQMPPVDYHANYIYVKDVVRAYLLAAQAPPTEHLIFNLGGFVYQNSEAVEILKRLVPQVTVHQEREYSLSHPMEVFDQDQSRARDEFGYEPVYTLEEGTKDYIKMVEAMGEQYRSALSAYEVMPLP
jgi:nucleoside-diphosphate-sugar epimerase